MQENLWLNLSTGHIGSGRPVRALLRLAAALHAWCSCRGHGRPSTARADLPCHAWLPPVPLQNWDGTGGTGAALKHYEETGRKCVPGVCP